ncbi:RNA polymerase sigma factor [Cellulomonas endophytica]|uniref:RNA polymerase sigma factor n=1 Tax=Cellulomonas endophytica TaxID=2494735 RepID=UPI001F0B9CFF|nr:sigma-70 family RNA polymerase sigma factor [Cellulomonas endophytica]
MTIPGAGPRDRTDGTTDDGSDDGSEGGSGAAARPADAPDDAPDDAPPDEDGATPVLDLVAGARAGRQADWDHLVERYAPLVRSVVRRYRLQPSDAEDVAQTIWLRLVEHLGDLREPQALPGWIVTTTRHECLRALRVRERARPVDPTSWGELVEAPAPDAATVDGTVLDAMTGSGRREALLAAFAELPQRHRDLLLLLLADPAPAYAEISRRLRMPVGSIGPTRARALERLRRHPAVAAWTTPGVGDPGGRAAAHG